MSYMLLIHEPVGQRAERTESEGRELYSRMQAFGEELATAGKLKAVESLAGTETATRISPSGIIDGPFAEAKEMVGGFFLLQNVCHDEAMNIAKRCPAAQWATVELRALAPCFVDSKPDLKT